MLEQMLCHKLVYYVTGPQNMLGVLCFTIEGLDKYVSTPNISEISKFLTIIYQN